MDPIIFNNNLVYPDLSFKLVGYANEVYNKLGFGHLEKIYQRGYAEVLCRDKIEFAEQVYHPVKLDEKIIGKLFFDFLVENRIVIELKKDFRYSKKHIEQVNEYLVASNKIRHTD